MTLALPTVGTIEFLQSTGPFGVLYPLFSGSQFSHSLVHVGGGKVFDAHIPRAGYRCYKEEWSSTPRLRFFPVKERLFSDLLAFCDRYEGAWYGIFQILGYLPVLNGNRKDNPNKKGLVCHEFIHHLLTGYYGLDLSAVKGHNEATDADLIDYLTICPSFTWEARL